MTATTHCPSCASPEIRLRVPETPETLSYRCSSCGASWSVDADAWLQEALDGTDKPTSDV